jgi:diguanylate cyclase (GGDEF)-like protein
MLDSDMPRDAPSPSPRPARAVDRLRADFQLSIVVLFGASSALLILPFGIYRALTGAWLVASLDLLLVAAIIGACGWAWWRGDTRRVGGFLAVVYTAGAVASAELLGVIGAFWMYAAIVANFFLLGRGGAWALSVASVAILGWRGEAFDDRAQLASFAATSVLVSFLAWILGNRTEAQRIQLEQLATRDALTGVHNRRALTEELALATEAFARGAPPAAIVVLDLDHFKRINDELGHEAGDRVLVAFADCVRARVRNVDRLFRLGGEEFVLLLSRAPSSGLRPFTDNLRERVRASLRGPDGPVTVSAGVALLRAGEDWESWLRRADAALYRAKASGRDRTEVAD